MKGFAKLLILALVLCQLLCCLAGCGKGNGDVTEVSESQIEDSSTFELTLESLSSFTVVYSDAEDMKRAALTFSSIVQDYTGTKPTVKADTEAETEYEVLIGLTNRTETLEYYKNLEQYDTGYALIGKKLLIFGFTKDAAADSAYLFKSNVLNGNEGGSLMNNGDSFIQKEEEKSGLFNWLENSKKSYYSSVLEGVTVNALGDSYFAGEGLPEEHVWLGLLESKYGMSMNNYGKGGSTVSYVASKRPMCERYKDMPNNDPDIILLEGGRNDFNQDVTIGAVDSTSVSTFSGALNVIIDGLQKKYPNAMIVCISNWNFPGTKNGKTYLSYANAMKAVAERQGVYFISAYDPKVSGIDMSDESFRATYCLKQSDISHLNLEGMKIAMTHFEKILAEYYQDFLSKK